MCYSEEALRERDDDLAMEGLSDGAYMSLALRQYAAAHGEAEPQREWILSPYDTWEKNPFFTGKPGRHPEDDYDDDRLEDQPVVEAVPYDPNEEIPF